jgi:AcrR family transcriptional regulator
MCLEWTNNVSMSSEKAARTGARIRGGATNTQATGETASRDPLNRARVLHAAMDLADERGIESVTMRELGRRLGVEAASLYNHVSGKGDILDGMADLVVAEIDLPTGGVDWRDAMRRRAVSARRVFSRHPWAAGLIDSREGGPSRLSYIDRVLGALLDAGFSPGTAANAFLALDSYVYGFERQRSNLSMGDGGDADNAAQEVLEALPPGSYVSLARVATEYTEKPYDDAAAFDFGLDLILDGLARLLE